MQIAIAIVGGLALLAFLFALVFSDDDDWLYGGLIVGAILTIALYVLALAK